MYWPGFNQGTETHSNLNRGSLKWKDYKFMVEEKIQTCRKHSKGEPPGLRVWRPIAGGQDSLEKMDGWGVCQLSEPELALPAEYQADTSLHVQLCQSWGQGTQREVGTAGIGRPGEGSVYIKRARAHQAQARLWAGCTTHSGCEAGPERPPSRDSPPPNREASCIFWWPQLTTCSPYRGHA